MRILHLDLDTLRPDHLGCYGYHRHTSPNIDWIASEGVRFDNYYASDAPCLPSRAALTTGQFGIHNGVINHGGACADRPPQGPGRNFFDSLGSGGSLTGMLRCKGLHTCYIGGFAERHSAYWYYSGFREIHDTGKGGMESAEDVTPQALDWLDQHASEDNWYLHLNYWDPHTPYRAPEGFGNPFENAPLPAWMTQATLDRHWWECGPHSSQDVNMYNNKTLPRFPRQPGEVPDMAAFRQLIDGYDCGIRYMDDHIGTLLDALRQRGVLDDLVIIVSSDHGENMGELGIYAEHGTADHITCRIPMIVRWPGKISNPGRADHGLHYNFDLLPTLADLLETPKKPYWEGASFAPSLADGTDTGHPELVISQCAHVCQRAVRWQDYLYIKTYHDGFRLFPQEMLFNIAADPHEEHDLAPASPDLCKEGAARLEKWHAQMMATMPFGITTDPMQTVLQEGGPFHAKGHLSKYIDRLQATGRQHCIPELTARHPQELQRAAKA